MGDKAAVMRRRLVLVAVAALSVGACELGPDIDAAPEAELAQNDGVDQKADGVVCGGVETPTTCVKACGMHSTGERPVCSGGKWRCEIGIPDNSCPNFTGPCTPNSPCGYGYTCVKSMNHAVPDVSGVCRKGELRRDSALESCSSFGNAGPGELLSNSKENQGQIVKVTGQVGVSLNCSDTPCIDGDPCCQSCAGNYVVGVINPLDPDDSVNVAVKTEVMSCAGTNCDVSCSPLLVGDTYTVWGVLDGCHGAKCTLLYMGGCPY